MVYCLAFIVMCLGQVYVLTCFSLHEWGFMWNKTHEQLVFVVFGSFPGVQGILVVKLNTHNDVRYTPFTHLIDFYSAFNL